MSATPRVRLSPEERRERLLDLGVRLFSRMSVDEISVDVLAHEAGVSRGLLYHYFGDKQGFREAVVRRAAADLVSQTAPPAEGDPLERLQQSVAAYLAYVEANYEGYLSLVRAAASDPALGQVYDDARATLTDRIFESDDVGLIPDTPAARLLVRSWAAMTEELVLTWVAAPGEVSREEVVAILGSSLPALVGVVSHS